MNARSRQYNGRDGCENRVGNRAQNRTEIGLQIAYKIRLRIEMRIVMILENQSYRSCWILLATGSMNARCTIIKWMAVTRLS